MTSVQQRTGASTLFLRYLFAISLRYFAGFRKNNRNAVFVMRILAERSIEMQKNLYAVFIDYEKAFDRVKHHESMKDLEQIGVDQKDRRFLKTLY